MGCIVLMSERIKSLVWTVLAGASLVSMYGSAHEVPVSSKLADVQRDTLPVRKNGLWEVTVHSDDLALRQQGQVKRSPVTVQMCTDREVDHVMLLAVVPAQENCQKIEVVRHGKMKNSGFDVRSICRVHDVKSEMQMELQGDFQARYWGRFSVTFSQMTIRNTGDMAFEGRWLGTCKPGQRPGDMVLPNGVTVNVVDDQKRAQAHSHEEHNHAH